MNVLADYSPRHLLEEKIIGMFRIVCVSERDGGYHER